MMSEVLIIGAGPAGLCSGYALERLHIPYLIVDRADHIGSTWSNLYPTLKLNTASIVSHMPGMAMPLSYGLFPSGRQYYAHLTTWAARHPLRIQLETNVERLSPEADGWRAETSAGSTWHPAVILASGRFSNSYVPPVPGLDTFTGVVLHARDFHDPAPFAGRRVLVVGSGPSGADIAVTLAEQSAAVFLSIRSDIVIARRNPWGINETIWKLLLRPLPSSLSKRLSDRLLYQRYPGIERLGLPLARNRDDRLGSSVPVRGVEFVRALQAGKIQPVRGLAALHGRCAQLDDGRQLEIDVLILATGYRPALSYLAVEYQTDSQGWPLRDTRESPESTALLGAPGLFLVGRCYRGLGALYNIRQEARMAANQIKAYLADRQQAG